MEHLSICVHYVDSAWGIKEVFLGLDAALKCDFKNIDKHQKILPAFT